MQRINFNRTGPPAFVGEQQAAANTQGELKIKKWIVRVSRNGLRLKKARELQDKLEVVLAAVRQNGRALFYATERMRGNECVVSAAVTQNGLALEFALPLMRNNRAIVLAAAAQMPWALDHTTEELTGDSQFLLLAIKLNSQVLDYMHHHLATVSRDFVLDAVKRNGFALEYAPQYCGDREIALAAAKQNMGAFQYASATLRGDKGFVLAIVREKGLGA
jgi:hypothetical protein